MRRLVALTALAALSLGTAHAQAPDALVYGNFSQAATHPLTGDAELGAEFLSFTDDRYLRTERVGEFDINAPVDPGGGVSWAQELNLTAPDARVVGTELRRVLSETAPPSNGLCGGGRTSFLALIEVVHRRAGSDHLRLIVIAFSDDDHARWCGWGNYWRS